MVSVNYYANGEEKPRSGYICVAKTKTNSWTVYSAYENNALVPRFEHGVKRKGRKPLLKRSAISFPNESRLAADKRKKTNFFVWTKKDGERGPPRLELCRPGGRLKVEEVRSVYFEKKQQLHDFLDQLVDVSVSDDRIKDLVAERNAKRNDEDPKAPPRLKFFGTLSWQMEENTAVVFRFAGAGGNDERIEECCMFIHPKNCAIDRYYLMKSSRRDDGGFRFEKVGFTNGAKPFHESNRFRAYKTHNPDFRVFGVVVVCAESTKKHTEKYFDYDTVAKNKVESARGEWRPIEGGLFGIFFDVLADGSNHSPKLEPARTNNSVDSADNMSQLRYN